MVTEYRKMCETVYLPLIQGQTFNETTTPNYASLVDWKVHLISDLIVEVNNQFLVLNQFFSEVVEGHGSILTNHQKSHQSHSLKNERQFQ